MKVCGLPIQSTDIIKLGHGSGGRLSEQLTEQIFLPVIGNPILNLLDDAALLKVESSSICVSTDSYVVDPLFFPGGDIGSLAVHGTVNDLSMRGAKPLYLTAGFIIEEGFPIGDLKKIVESFQDACVKAGVSVIAADTKVVNRGSGDGVFINTTGIGICDLIDPPSSTKIQIGDRIVVNGDLGRHGIAILSRREGIDLETEIVSDSMALNKVVSDLLDSGISINCMRDITRGGLSSVLNELAVSSSVGIEIEQKDIPVNQNVMGVCELLGLDPLYVACEGRFVSFVKESNLESFLSCMEKSSSLFQPKVIGKVVDSHPQQVVLNSLIGGKRVLDKLSGDQLPRIC